MKKLISQQVLQQYRRLQEQEKTLKLQREAIRDGLIKMLRDGAAVEKGALNATLEEYSKRYAVQRENCRGVRNWELRMAP